MQIRYAQHVGNRGKAHPGFMWAQLFSRFSMGQKRNTSIKFDVFFDDFPRWSNKVLFTRFGVMHWCHSSSSEKVAWQMGEQFAEAEWIAQLHKQPWSLLACMQRMNACKCRFDSTSRHNLFLFVRSGKICRATCYVFVINLRCLHPSTLMNSL